MQRPFQDTSPVAMAGRAFCIAILLASLLVSASSRIDTEVVPFSQTDFSAEELPGTLARRLLQDSSVCGFNEYFCGETSFIADTAYNAVSAGNCFNDTGTARPSQSPKQAKSCSSAIDVLCRRILLRRCKSASGAHGFSLWHCQEQPEQLPSRLQQLGGISKLYNVLLAGV